MRNAVANFFRPSAPNYFLAQGLTGGLVTPAVLNSALSQLVRRGEKFELVTVGPVEELSETFRRTTLPENDEFAHVFPQL